MTETAFNSPLIFFFALQIQQEQWRRLHLLNDYDQPDGSRLTTAVFFGEYSATEYDFHSNSESSRFDMIYMVPILFYRQADEAPQKTLSSLRGFWQYRHGSLPVTKEVQSDIKLSLQDDGLRVTCSITGLANDLFIPASDPLITMIRKCGNCGFAVAHNGQFVFTRASLKPESPFPEFPCVKGSFLNKKQGDSDLQMLIQNAAKYKIKVPARLDSYLDVQVGGSDYSVYESTSSVNSLPTPPKLGTRCWSCGKTEITREHCSPKWLADYFHVTPLVAPIFCSQCNSWFGENLELPMSHFLLPSSKSSFTKKELMLIITNWAIKTALTMSLASAVRVQQTWLHSLRKGQPPEGFRVFFDQGVPLNKPGFNFGVSRFADGIVNSGGFLFTMSTPLFTLCVVRTTKEITVPLLEIFPKVSKPTTGIQGNFADMHQAIHESISGEPTVPNELPQRPQRRK